MSKHGLKQGERIAARALVYVEEWCDGNGNLGPCSCADDPKNRNGHWRLGRTIPLEELLQRVAETQREACALQLHGLLKSKQATAVWVGADEIRATPLVTE